MLHHKFFVVDGKVAVYGSCNWTIAAFKRNDEALLVTSDGSVLRELSAGFERMWRDLRAGRFDSGDGDRPRPPASLRRLYHTTNY
jgi:phosphatidylserine/phosphatidylglycerophosphate/cardiolipin synthase-like enzyme